MERQPSNAAVVWLRPHRSGAFIVDLKHNMKEYIWLLLHSSKYFTVDTINSKYKNRYNPGNFDRLFINGLAEAIYKHLQQSLARMENNIENNRV